jgi:hypothetical protein
MLQTSPISGGTAFHLPPRRLPWALGAVPLVMGLVFTSFMIFWMGGPIGWFDRQSPPAPTEVEADTPRSPRWHPDPAAVAFSLLGLPGLLIGLGLLTAGVAVLARLTRCSLEVDEQHLRVREHLGWLRWTWRMPLPEVRALSVLSSRRGAVTAFADDDALGFLLVRRAHAADRWCVAGYPRQVIQQLAHQLHAAMARHGRSPVVLQSDPATGHPPGDLEVQEDADGLTIRRKVARFPTSLRVAVVLTTVVLVGAWLAAAHYGLGVGMVAGFVTMVALMTVGGAVISSLRASARAAYVRVARGTVEAKHVPGAGSFAAVHQSQVVENGSGSARYRAITLRAADKGWLGEFRWPSHEEWIARRIDWALQGRTGDVPATPLAEHRMPPLNVPVAASAPPTGEVVEALLLPHPACRGAVVFGVFFAAIPLGVLTLISALANEPPLPAIPIVGLFVVGGTVLAWWGLRQYTRRTTLRLRDGVLEIDQRDWRAHLTRQFPVAEITAIRAEPTGTTMNEWIVHRLRVVLRDGTRHDTGTQAHPEHLRQVAADLCRSLGLRDDRAS